MYISPKDKDYYLSSWRNNLYELLGWSETDVLSWAEQSGRLVQLNNANDSLYHESPIYWIVDLLVPNSLRKTLSPKRRAMVRRELLQVLNNENKDTRIRETEWNTYKTKINQVLQRYGTQLPECKSQQKSTLQLLTFSEVRELTSKPGAFESSYEVPGSSPRKLMTIKYAV